MVDLSVNVGRLRLQNPVMNASGTCGYGQEYADYLPLDRLGGFVTKTVTRDARQGNPPPRICETACGMLNSIGLANVGVERLITDHLPHLKGVKARIIVSIGGNSVDEYREVAERLSAQEGVDGLELNLSCPNVKQGGLHFGRAPEVVHQVVSVVRDTTSLFMAAKLSPHSDLLEVARAAAEGGCDGVTLINTLPGMAIDVRGKASRLGNITGGLSGPAIKPVAVYWTYKVAEELQIPVIGVGGITTCEDALEFIIAGASAVQIGTANFIDPTTPLEVIDGMREFCESEGIDRLESLVHSLDLQKSPDGDQATK